MTRDVYAASDKLLANGVRFQKKPDEGRMKGIAFALDPDGYWIELVSRDERSPVTNEFTLAQTMIRVKDPVKSLRFYCELLGMRKVKESHHSDFSLFFLAHLSSEEEAIGDPRMLFPPVLELTHNHGTESNPEFRLVKYATWTT
jgi:lactoylglutathione lyase